MSKGKCKFCGQDLEKDEMFSHLQRCESRKCGYYSLVITSDVDGDYWIIAEVNEKTKLSELDQFLRKSWGEGGLTAGAFWINGQVYKNESAISLFRGEASQNLDIELKDILKEISSFAYLFSYEHPSSPRITRTAVTVEVRGYNREEQKSEMIMLLSRNNPVERLCGQCHTQKANWYDSWCYNRDNPYWCDTCMESKADEDEADFFEPLCNSPRMIKK